MIKTFSKEGAVLCLNSEDERFKLVYIDANLTYDHESWKLDRSIFERAHRDPKSYKFSSGQVFITVACLSVSEYMEIYSYMLRQGWSKRIRWSEEFKKRFNFDYWDRYAMIEEVKFSMDDFSKLLIKHESCWGLFFDESDSSLHIDVLVDFYMLDKFRTLMKGLSKFGYKAVWYDGHKKINIVR